LVRSEHSQLRAISLISFDFADFAESVHPSWYLTGRPKGCVLPNEYFLCAGHWYANVGDLIALHEGTERMLTPLPVFHMNATAYSAMAMVMTGGCLIALDRFHRGAGGRASSRAAPLSCTTSA
jgi:hypothetical protein